MSDEIKREPHADEATGEPVAAVVDVTPHAPVAPDATGEHMPEAVDDDAAEAAYTAVEPEPEAVEPTDAEPGTAEAEFAASESDQPVETAHGLSTAPVVEPDPAPVIAAAAVTSSASAPRPIWSDQGDAPFDDRKEKIPAAARVVARDDDDEGGSAASETVEIVKTIVVALAIAFVLRVLLFQPFTIPSASMEPNLYEGDYIVVSKWAYGYSKFSSGLPINLPLGDDRLFGRAPNRGDIVVFKLPRDDKTDYIKRVIGLPGDKIQMIANKLYINGAPVQDVVVGAAEVSDVFGPRPVTEVRETLANGRTFMTQDFGPNGDLDDTGVYEVPVGHYFMMGDNRDNSIDSRVQQSAGVGLVPDENLVGKAEIIMFSWSPGASLWNPVSWFQNIRLSRFFKILD